MASTKVRPLGHCSRCTRAWWPGASDEDRWNTVHKGGRLTVYLCPQCQTPEENAEAEVKAALIDYDHPATDSDGRVRLAPRGGWHSVAVGTHSVVQSDPAVHLALGIENTQLNIGVAAHTDADCPTSSPRPAAATSVRSWSGWAPGPATAPLTTPPPPDSPRPTCWWWRITRPAPTGITARWWSSCPRR